MAKKYTVHSVEEVQRAYSECLDMEQIRELLEERDRALARLGVSPNSSTQWVSRDPDLGKTNALRSPTR